MRYDESFENGNDAEPITGTNTILTSFTRNGGLLDFDTEFSFVGSKSLRVYQPTDGVSTFANLPVPPSNSVAVRFYIRLTAAPTANGTDILNFRNASSNAGQFRLNADGTIRLVNSTGSSGGAGSVLGGPLPLNQWVRVEGLIVTSNNSTTPNGRMLWAWYLGDSTTPQFSHDTDFTNNTGLTDISEIRIGKHSGTGTIQANIDGFSVFTDYGVLPGVWTEPPPTISAAANPSTGLEAGLSICTLDATSSTGDGTWEQVLTGDHANDPVVDIFGFGLMRTFECPMAMEVTTLRFRFSSENAGGVTSVEVTATVQPNVMAEKTPSGWIPLQEFKIVP